MRSAALITGGSRGIGRGIAVGLAAAGWDLLLTYNSNRDAAEETAKSCTEAGSRVELFKADISNREDRNRLVQFAQDEFPRLELLVNNAGMAPRQRADILDATEESFDELMGVNVKGPYFLTQAIARWMIQSKAGISPKENPAAGLLPEYRPKIVTISSISAYTASVNRGDYCISKAALSMLTPLFASRLAECGILVYEIRPGVIATDMTAGVQGKYDKLIAEGLTPIQRWGQADDVARAVKAIAQDAFPFSTGEVINVDGGFHLRRL